MQKCVFNFECMKRRNLSNAAHVGCFSFIVTLTFLLAGWKSKAKYSYSEALFCMG